MDKKMEKKRRQTPGNDGVHSQDDWHKQGARQGLAHPHYDQEGRDKHPHDVTEDNDIHLHGHGHQDHDHHHHGRGRGHRSGKGRGRGRHHYDYVFPRDRENYHREWSKYHKAMRFMPLFFLATIVLLIGLFMQASVNQMFGTVVMVLLTLFIIKELVQAVFFYRFSQRVYKPLLKLKEGVERVAEGDYDYKIPYKEPRKKDPRKYLTALFTSFNAMTASLRKAQSDRDMYEENRKALIGNISHDLKTPIAAIDGYVEALQDGVATTPEKQDKYLKIIGQNTKYMRRLIDDLFLFSQLDSEQLQFEWVVTEGHGVIMDMVEEFALDIQERGGRVEVDNQVQPPVTLTIDQKRLYQAMRNIVQNAIKYGPEDHLHIAFDLERVDQGDQAYLLVHISDNGQGIPPGEEEQIFNRFYRVDSPRTKKLESTGLGLAITKELINAHDGWIIAGNQEGGGARFTIGLPIINHEEGA